MKKRLLILSFLFVLPFLGFAKEPKTPIGLTFRDQPRNQMDIHFDMFAPTGAFAQTLNGSNPAGFGFNYLRRIGPRWSVGAEVGVAMYYSAEYVLQTHIGPVEMYEEDCFWTVRALARYYLVETETFKGFTEFRLGANNFFSDVSAQEEVVADVGKTVSHGNSLVAGIGLGGELGLGAVNFKSGKKGSAFVSVRTAYNFGSPTYYRSANVPSGISNDFEDHRYYSEISYIDVNLGFGMHF